MKRGVLNGIPSKILSKKYKWLFERRTIKDELSK